MQKTILFVTGTRADFGKLKPLIREVARDGCFDYRIFVTGMHMLSRYGSTVIEVQNSGFKNIFTFINYDGALNTGMDLALANTIQGLGHYIREFPADLIVVHGDRTEALAGAIVGALHNVLVAHVEGGEVSGTVDELLRHAISKLSHLHFVANEDSRTRLVQMGEVPETVHVIGSPDIDVMLSDGLPTLTEVRARYGIPFERYLVFLYHPVTTEVSTLRERIQAVTAALEACREAVVLLYPNNDTGSAVILEALSRFNGREGFRLLPSMRFEFFLTLLRHAKAIVGNSSAGIREAPVYGVPTVNIGTRQMNRFCYPSIVTVPEDETRIVDALLRLPEGVPPSTHFGKGNSAGLFIDLLRTEALWRVTRQKQFRDLRVMPVPGPETVSPQTRRAEA
jgi:UDP-N-acetylglucosamine 2-epimerase (hydrolysing)